METTPRPRSSADIAHTSDASTLTIIQLVVLFLGLSVPLTQYLSPGGLTLTPAFLLGVLVSVVGWWRGINHPFARIAAYWAVAFAVWVVLSLVSVGDIGGLKGAGGMFWLALTPGIAMVLTDKRLLLSMIAGFALGAAVLLVIVVFRVAKGANVLDVRTLQLLGGNRNEIDMHIVWILPAVAAAPILRVPRLFKLLFLIGSLVWLLGSQGRTGLLALLMAPLIYFLAGPPRAGGSRAPRVVAVVVLASVLWVGLLSVRVPWLPAADRLVQLQSDDRTNGDDVRSLLNKKSYAVTSKHPVFGVGLGRYEGFYDPVVEEATTEFMRYRAITAPAHNTYLEIAASTGIPGLVFFLGLVLSPLLFALRTAHDRSVRALGAGYAVLLFSITFHVTLGGLPALPLATLLAMTMVAHDEKQSESLT